MNSKLKSAESQRRFRVMWSGGCTVAEMAVEFGCSEGTVQDWRRRLNLPARNPAQSRPRTEDELKARRVDEVERARQKRFAGLSAYEVRRLAGMF